MRIFPRDNKNLTLSTANPSLLRHKSLFLVNYSLESVQSILSTNCDRKNSDTRVLASDQTLPIRMRSTGRSEEHTSDLPPLMRISLPVFCLQKTIKLQNASELLL